MKLDKPLKLNNNVQPACLPEANFLPKTASQDKCYTSGWGTLQSGGSSPTNLHYVKVPAVSNAKCKEDYGGSAITDSMLCAGYPGVGGKDACQGDSGGPYVCDKAGDAVLAGVVSWGNECARPDYLGVYARNTEALQWIKDNMVSTRVVIHSYFLCQGIDF